MEANERKEYERIWYEKNKDKVYDQHRRYYQKYPEKQKKASTKWRQENRDKVRAANKKRYASETPEQRLKRQEVARQWYEKNKDKVRAKSTALYYSDPEKSKERAKQWARDNREKIAQRNAKRLAKLKSTMTPEQEQEYKLRVKEYNRRYRARHPKEKATKKEKQHIFTPSSVPASARYHNVSDLMNRWEKQEFHLSNCPVFKGPSRHSPITRMKKMEELGINPQTKELEEVISVVTGRTYKIFEPWNK